MGTTIDADSSVSEPDEWLTVREAAARAGVSVSGIRKWYGNGTVESKKIDGPYGPQVMVRLADVYARKDEWDGRPWGESHSDPEVPNGMVLVDQRSFEVLADLSRTFQASWHDLSVQLSIATAEAAAAKERALYSEVRLAELRAELDAQRAEEERPPARRRWFGRS